VRASRRYITSGFLVMVLVNIALVGWAAIRFPAILGGDRIVVVLLDVAILVAYGVGAKVLFRGRPGRGLEATIAAVFALGVALGLVHGADIAREYVVSLPPPWPLVDIGAVLLFSLAGFLLSGVLAGNLAGGARAGTICAATAMLVLWLSSWGLNFGMPARLQTILIADPEYAAGTLRDPAAYAFYNTISSALSHAIVLPFLGAVFGALGGATSARLDTHRSPTSASRTSTEVGDGAASPLPRDSGSECQVTRPARLPAARPALLVAAGTTPGDLGPSNAQSSPGGPVLPTWPRPHGVGGQLSRPIAATRSAALRLRDRIAGGFRVAGLLSAVSGCRRAR